MIKIVEYNNNYAKELSEIILDNMYKINIKEHGKEVIDRISKHFTENEIKKNFPNRTKCLVALKDNEVVGTASINKYKGDTTGEKYILLTVFVKIENHHQGIGRKLYNKVESLNNKGFFTVNSSPYAHEVYKHLGFIDTDTEQCVNGLIFFPMKKNI